MKNPNTYTLRTTRAAAEVLDAALSSHCAGSWWAADGTHTLTADDLRNMADCGCAGSFADGYADKIDYLTWGGSGAMWDSRDKLWMTSAARRWAERITDIAAAAGITL